MANEDEHIVDSKGNEIKVGDRVFIDSVDDEKIPTRYIGTITRITDMDGDVDDEGRSIAIHPDVVVKFDIDGIEESFSTYYDSGDYEYGDLTFSCDDLEKEVSNA